MHVAKKFTGLQNVCYICLYILQWHLWPTGAHADIFIVKIQAILPIISTHAELGKLLKSKILKKNIVMLSQQTKTKGVT